MIKKLLFYLVAMTASIYSFGTGSSDCSTSTEVSTGTYTADNSEGDQWFIYTNNEDSQQVITISSCGLTTEDTYVYLYSSCNVYQTASNDDYCNGQSQLIHVLGVGESVYINWGDSYTSSSFDWSITTNDVEGGEVCDVALVAEEGVNVADNSKGDQWFSFTNNESTDKFITVSSCDLTTVDTYVSFYAFCNGSSLDYNDDFCDNQSQLSYVIEAGETIYIKWDDYYSYGSGEYKWNLTLEDVPDGASCGYTIEASVGVNSTDNSNGDQWFSYTNTESKGQLITVSSCGLTTAETYLYLYRSCDDSYVDYSSYDCGSQSELTYPLGAGETVYIKWDAYYTTASYDWSLTSEDIPEGTSCVNPIVASLGTNTADNSDDDQWFSYTNIGSVAQSITVSSCDLTTLNTELYLYKDCDDYYSYSSNYCGSQSSITYEISVGETVYLRWSDYYESGEFDWSITAEDLPVNEECANGAPAIVGANTADNSEGDDWFYYTNTSDDAVEVTISSCDLTNEDTYVLIYNHCSASNSVAFSDDFCDYQSQITYTMDPQETIYIKWDDYYAGNDTKFDWTFTGPSEEDPSALYNELSNRITVVPNVSSGEYVFNEMLEQVVVINSSGVEVGNMSNVSSIDISNVPSGLYLLKIEVQGVWITKKVIKE